MSKTGVNLSDMKSVIKPLATPKRSEKINFDLSNAIQTVNKRY